jgi:hypothetical protein
MHPEENLLRESAFEKYCRGNHYHQMLKSLIDKVQEVRQGTPFNDDKYFSEIGHFLQYMLLHFNGNRAQSVGVLLNKNLGESFSVEVGSEDDMSKVNLSMKDLLETDHISVKMVGVGKTRIVEFQIPKEIAIALMNYYFLKKNIGLRMKGNDPLFVDFRGRSLSTKSLYHTNIYRTIVHLMDLDHFPATGRGVYNCPKTIFIPPPFSNFIFFPTRDIVREVKFDL